MTPLLIGSWYNMKKEIIIKLKDAFEDQAHEVDGIQFWFARDLQILLGYSKWENFVNVLDRAKESCRKSGFIVADHFPEVRKKVDLGSGAEREIDDYLLTRYACYLIAQNGDPRKEEIAFAQSYFAIQTRKQELIEQRIELIERLEARKRLTASETELSKIIYEQGVDDAGFGRIRSKGDAALFGGKTTREMKRQLCIPPNRAMADFLPTITITAKNLATEITNFNVKKDDLQGENKITDEHIRNNADVRNLLVRRGIRPEELPAEEDLKRLERKVKSDELALAGNKKKPRLK